jgi:hypothetical protein
MSERLPEDKFGLRFLAAFAAFAIGFAVGDVLMGIGEEKEADGCYQDQEKNPDVGLRKFHD